MPTQPVTPARQPIATPAIRDSCSASRCSGAPAAIWYSSKYRPLIPDLSCQRQVQRGARAALGIEYGPAEERLHNAQPPRQQVGCDHARMQAVDADRVSDERRRAARRYAARLPASTARTRPWHCSVARAAVITHGPDRCEPRKWAREATVDDARTSFRRSSTAVP